LLQALLATPCNIYKVNRKYCKIRKEI